MQKKILLIDHHDNPRDDLATTHLQNLGFELELCCPFQGDTLPKTNQPYSGAVIYGGEANVTQIDQYPFLKQEISWIKQAIADQLPILGICLGAQLIAHYLGAKVDKHESGLCEFGYYMINPTEDGQKWFEKPMLVTQAHYQHFSLPESATCLATGENFPNQAFKYGDNVFAVQFHPEVTADIFKRWQNSDWAFFGQPGTQTREQQNPLIEDADRVQGEWFRGFLEKFFGNINKITVG